MNEQMSKWQGRLAGYDVTVVVRGSGHSWHPEVMISNEEAQWSSVETPMRELDKSYSSDLIALELGKLWASDAVRGGVRGIALPRK